MIDIPELSQEIRRLNLQPGSTLRIRVQHSVTPLGMKQLAAWLKAAFPEIQFTILDTDDVEIMSLGVTPR